MPGPPTALDYTSPPLGGATQPASATREAATNPGVNRSYSLVLERRDDLAPEEPDHAHELVVGVGGAQRVGAGHRAAAEADAQVVAAGLAAVAFDGFDAVVGGAPEEALARDLLGADRLASVQAREEPA